MTAEATAPGREFVLGVDLDGVCGDHATAFREVVALERGVDPDTLPPHQSWNFHEWGLTVKMGQTQSRPLSSQAAGTH